MSKPPLSDAVKRAFLIGAKYGFRRARKELRRDMDGLLEEAHDACDRAHALLAAVRSERLTDGTGNERDPETPH